MTASPRGCIQGAEKGLDRSEMMELGDLRVIGIVLIEGGIGRDADGSTSYVYS